MAFEQIGLGGELTFEIEQAVVAMAQVTERFKKMQESAQSTEPKVETLRMKIEAFGKDALKNVKQIGDGFKDLGRSVRNTTLAFLPVTYGMKKGFESALQFERQMGQLAAQTGATREEVEQMGKAAKQMAVGTEDAPTEILQAMENLKAVGATVPEVISSVTHALDLADAVGMKEAEAATLVGQTIRAMGASFSDAQRFVDVMAKTSADSGANILELSQGIRMASTQARTMGVSFEEMNAVLGVLSQAGFKGSRGGMALSNMLRSLANPTTEASQQLAAWGISLTDAQGKLLPISQIVTSLNKKMKGVPDAARRAELAYKIFGGRGQQAFEALAATGESALQDFSKNLFNSAGEAKKMSDLQLGNAWGAFKTFWNNVKILSEELFEPFLKPVTDAVRGMTDWIAGVARGLMEIKDVGLESFLSQADQSGKKLSNVQEIAVGISQALGDLKEMWNGLVQAVSSFGDEFGKMFGVEGPRAAARTLVKVLAIGGALVPIVGTVGAFGTLISKTIIPALTGVWKIASGIGGLFSSLGVWALPVVLVFGAIAAYMRSTGKEVKSLGDVIRGVWESLQNTVGAFLQGFVSKLGDIWESTKSVLNGIGRMFDTLFGWIWEGNKKAGEGMASVWGGVGEFIGTVISTILEGFGKLFDVLGDFIVQSRTALQKFLLGVEETWSAVRKNVDEKERNRLAFIRSQIEADTRKYNVQFAEEKAKQKASLEAAKAGLETKLAGKKPEDKVNVDVTVEDKRTTSIKNTLCVDGKQVATAISRSQTEIMERAGAKKEAWQKTASREFGVPPTVKKLVSIP